jgi:hypothetical protein
VTTIARLDPGASVRVTGRTPLSYARGRALLGADEAADRPAHVRAGSSLAWFDGRWVVTQDDTNVLALLDPTTGDVTPLLLPRGAGGARQFDEARGNKADKLDLEASVVVPCRGREVLLLLGSGSSPARERIGLVRGLSQESDIELFDARAFYGVLRRCTELSGSELNIEGAARVDERLLLLQRGNGAEVGGVAPVDAIGEIGVAALVEHLIEGAPVPRLERIRRFDLGSIDGARLTFTDLAVSPSGEVWFCAAAEASPDATRDGPVTAVAIGRLHADGSASYAPLLDEQGARCTCKIEGIGIVDAGTLLAVVDADDAARPAELLRLRVSAAPVAEAS